jgi:adenylate cyclase
MSDRPPSFLDELKRRRVVRVGVVYGAVAYAVLEVTDILIGTFGLPEALQSGIGVAVLAGFPIALVLGWAFDVTPEGIQRTEALASADTSTSSSSWITVRSLGAAGLFLVVGLGAGWLTGRAGAATGSDGAIRSIAVLPFEDLSPDGDQAYFADGIAEELLNVLTRNDQLCVAARTSAFAMGRSGATIAEVGEALGVESVVEGSVRKAGDNVRITAQLIQVSDGFHLWSETYEGDLEDIFALQDRISLAIAEELQVELGMDRSDGSLKAQPQVDLQAYDLFLRARPLLASRLPLSIREAIELLTRAIDIDPSFVAGHAKLGEAYTLLPVYDGTALPHDYIPLGKVMADRAIDLDPSHPDGWAVRGLIGWAYDWDFPQAELELARAIELSPGHASAHNWRGVLLQSMGRPEAMRESCETAMELDPLYNISLLCQARALWYIGDLEGSKLVYERMIELHPRYVTGAGALAELVRVMGDPDRARDLQRQVAMILGFGDPDGYAEVMVPRGRDQIAPEDRPAAVALIKRMVETTTMSEGTVSQRYYFGRRAAP